MNRTPLYEAQKKAGAAFGEYLGWELPTHFSSAQEEYVAAKKGAVLVDRSYIGRLKMTGEDALDLLNRLSTNDLSQLPVGLGLTTVLTTSKGRIVDLLTIYSIADGILILTSPQNRQKVIAWIDQYTFAEEVTLEDITEALSTLSIFGPNASKVLNNVRVLKAEELAPHHGTTHSVAGIDVYVAREDPRWGQAYNILVPSDHVSDIWDEILNVGDETRPIPMGASAYEIMRIEAGVPSYGTELSEDVNPLEAGLNSSISFTKGCYVGQEVVARLNTYKKVKRLLAKIRFEEGLCLRPNAPLSVDGKEVGVITSAAMPTDNGSNLVLGYVRISQAKAGVEIDAATDGGPSVKGQIVEVLGE